MIFEKRGCIDYDERGHGPTLVLVPGSCSTGAAWRPVVSRLSGRFRCVTTSLLGYGGTTERRQTFDTDIADEAEILESVIRRAGCPVHLVGHSFGGLVSLAVALRERVQLRSLTVIEAPAVQLLPHAGEHDHYHAFRQMTGEYFAAYFAGDPAAIEPMIDFYGGAGTFAAWPEHVRRYVVDTTSVNIFDWADAYGFELTPALLTSINIPTVVLCGEQSHPAMRRLSGLLGQCIPGASAITVPGAAHFMISTHPGEVARIIDREVARSEIMNRSAAA
jgi:pimeloyl-ACP methyl ester carboxylesterase